MDIVSVRHTLENVLATSSRETGGRLPGGDAHRLLAPVPRPGWIPGTVPADGKPSAVLVLLYPLHAGDSTAESTGLLLTKRTASVTSHRLQICFPGGAVDAGETFEEAAARETEEEVGIPREEPRLLGRMSPLWISATGYTVIPILATIDELPELNPNNEEVASVIEQPLADLMAPGSVLIEKRSTDGIWIDAPYFTTAGGGGRLWGATAMMTAELLVMLGWSGPGLET